MCSLQGDSCEEFVKERDGRVLKYRPLTELDAEAYRSIRFEALQTAPEAFASSYEEEKELPVDAFKARLKGEDSVTFGMFDGESLVGVTTLLTETNRNYGTVPCL